jgi:hypothetical protein
MPKRGRKNNTEGITVGNKKGDKTPLAKDDVADVEKKIVYVVPDKLILRVSILRFELQLKSTVLIRFLSCIQMVYLMSNSRWNECLKLSRKCKKLSLSLFVFSLFTAKSLLMHYWCFMTAD